MNNHKIKEAITLDQFPDRTHVNVMESLVAQEVEKQRARLPENLARYIDPVEVATYALNRLPPLYACNKKGWHHQQQHAKIKFGSQIPTAVRQAIAAVQRDPLKVSEPLKPEETELREAQAALEALQDLLEHREISWHNLVDVVKQALTKKAVDSVRQAISQKAFRHFTKEQAKELAAPDYDWIDSRYHL
ncbi:MAG: late competence development ComFB family protein [Symploca sp. SIO1B1]|nr:late competence development ComFB family protein [Symploca sp. SIO2D2]NER23797.1 late competence development ComFB family protein [Symploca sp. SIO1C2]NER46682.1 late competence development ComFB family protein [Symploca sp. SIO1A3]NER92968.1 late competence development ComFB family protein [Symploca sp. SIO1B1]